MTLNCINNGAIALIHHYYDDRNMIVASPYRNLNENPQASTDGIRYDMINYVK